MQKFMYPWADYHNVSHIFVGIHLFKLSSRTQRKIKKSDHVGEIGGAFR